MAAGKRVWLNGMTSTKNARADEKRHGALERMLWFIMGDGRHRERRWSGMDSRGREQADGRGVARPYGLRVSQAGAHRIWLIYGIAVFQQHGSHQLALAALKAISVAMFAICLIIVWRRTTRIWRRSAAAYAGGIGVTIGISFGL